MIIAILFFLGVFNFTAHNAVLDSKHPLLRQSPRIGRANPIRITMVLEFAILVAAMLLADNGWAGMVWGYAIYSAINAISAWLILTRKI